MIRADSEDEDLDFRIAQAGLLGEVLKRVGYSVWQVAECEDTLAHFVTLRIHAQKGMGEADGLALLAKAQSLTFGNLFAQLRKHGILEDALADRISVLRDERNWLVHSAKRENRGMLNDPQRVDSLVARLSSIAEEATELQALLARDIEEFVLSHGIDKETIDHEAALLAAEWGY